MTDRTQMMFEVGGLTEGEATMVSLDMFEEVMRRVRDNYLAMLRDKTYESEEHRARLTKLTTMINEKIKAHREKVERETNESFIG